MLARRVPNSFAGKVALYYLPYLTCDDWLVRLPCPANELVAFCTAIVQQDPARRARQISESLRRNPSLLVYALSHFFQAHQKRADDFTQLVAWLPCCTTILDALPATHFDNDPELIESIVTSVRKFVHKPKKIMTRLSEFLRRASTLLPAEITSLLQPIISSKLGEQLARQGKKVRRRRADAAASVWLKGYAVTGEVPNMLSHNLVCSTWHNTNRLLTLQQNFESELESRKLASLRQLAYGASHEINNPLANIASRAQSLMLEETNPDRAYRLSVIFTQAMRARDDI